MKSPEDFEDTNYPPESLTRQQVSFDPYSLSCCVSKIGSEIDLEEEPWSPLSESETTIWGSLESAAHVGAEHRS